MGDTLNYPKVRLHDGSPSRGVTMTRKARPRTTCRERILPPEKVGEVITTKPAAVALWNTVLFDEDWYLDDYLPDYPDRIGLIAAMIFAHELTHIWQWQNRKTTGYSPLRAAFEHGGGADPYLFDLESDPKFLDFAFEQQGSIVEEFVCCRALDPQAPRTKRLHALISQEMPVAPLPQSRPYAVRMPWDGVEVRSEEHTSELPPAPVVWASAGHPDRQARDPAPCPRQNAASPVAGGCLWHRPPGRRRCRPAFWSAETARHCRAPGGSGRGAAGEGLWPRHRPLGRSARGIAHSFRQKMPPLPRGRGRRAGSVRAYRRPAPRAAARRGRLWFSSYDPPVGHGDACPWRGSSP